MKKTFLILVVAVFGILSFALAPNLAFGTSPATTIPVTTTTIDSTTPGFSYTDLNDLIDQIYAELRAQIYAQIYAELSQMIGDDLYEDIYAAVIARFDELVDAGTIPVVINQFQDQINAVVARADKSVFGISTYLGSVGKSLGSGVVYRYDQTADVYYLITNQHVVDGGDNYRIVFADESWVEATLLGVDVEADIAILSFSGAATEIDIVVSPLASDNAAKPGQIVLAVGNPRGYSFYGSVTMGVVSGIKRDVDNDPFVLYVQHDASINSGNSGGPIYNLDGEVVGINVSKYVSNDIEGMGFSIPIALVKRIIERVEAGNLSQQTIKPRLQASWLDVSGAVDSNNEVLLSSLDVDPLTKLTNVKIKLPTGVTKGLLIRTLEVSGTLYDGGITVGDLIVKVGDHEISTWYDLYVYLYANFESGNNVTIWYYDFNAGSLNYDPILKSTTINFQ
jgi:serine protease Do